ncbi:MAG: ATP-binding protein, partial [Myxococcota bacterium]
MENKRLTADECCLRLDPRDLGLSTTDDVEPLGVASQARALEALRFGLDIRQPRFHVVVVGEPGSGRTFSARALAQHLAEQRPTPDELLLLPNAKKPSEPLALRLPAGEGRPFVEAMERLHEDLVESLRQVAEGERFKQSRARIERKARAAEAELSAALKEVGEELGLVVNREEDELHVAAPDGEDPDPEALEAIGAAVEEFEEQVAELSEGVDRELRDELKRLMVDAVKARFGPLKGEFEDRGAIVQFLDDTQTMVNKEVRGLIDESEESGTLAPGSVIPTLLTEREPGSGAPVVEVAYPTIASLFGRSHVPADAGFPPKPGFAVPGALHRADGGFLIISARTLLKNRVYEPLKACLLSGNFVPPEPDASYFRGTVEELLLPTIPIDVKVVLVASPMLYQELHEADPEFSQLFKVQARFGHTIELDEAKQTYPRFLAGFLRDRGLPPLNAEAVAELIGHGCRLAESQQQATAQMGAIAEVATEAGFRAMRDAETETSGHRVREALDASRRRGGYVEEEIRRLFTDGSP